MWANSRQSLLKYDNENWPSCWLTFSRAGFTVSRHNVRFWQKQNLQSRTSVCKVERCGGVYWWEVQSFSTTLFRLGQVFPQHVAVYRPTNPLISFSSACYCNLLPICTPRDSGPSSWKKGARIGPAIARHLVTVVSLLLLFLLLPTDNCHLGWQWDVSVGFFSAWI